MDVALEETICDSVKYTLTSWNQHWYSTHKIDIYEINMFLRIYVRPPPKKKKPTKFTFLLCIETQNISQKLKVHVDYLPCGNWG